MDEKNVRLVYNASLRNIIEQNESFDSAVLAIAYTGINQNGSSISRDVFEKCAKSIYNVPVVANYSREDDMIGGHDSEIVIKDGVPTLINITQPVGVVPESAQYWWENIIENDGSEHEYFCTDVLLWKRQEAYAKIKSDGITAQSMEINVKSSHLDSGIYIIEDFEFLAFCLLGTCEPCFESAALTVFSDDTFTAELHSMLAEVPSVDMTRLEGVNKSLNEKLKLMEQFDLKIEDLDFELADFELEELAEKFEAVRITLASNTAKDTHTAESESEQEAEPAVEHNDELDANPEIRPEAFSLTANQFRASLMEAVEEETVHTEWGDCPRYWLFDYDAEKFEAYCEDFADNCKWVGLNFIVNGDVITVDFNGVFPIKAVYLPIEAGEDQAIFGAAKNCAEMVAESMESKFSTEKEVLNSQIDELKSFKQSVLDERRAADENSMFEKFSDLNGNEAFEALKANCSAMNLDDIEEKCFAIRGRMTQPQNFSKQTPKKAPSLPVDRDENVDEPYGTLFAKYLH